jgi:hypothetical protein
VTISCLGTAITLVQAVMAGRSLLSAFSPAPSALSLYTAATASLY